MPQHTVSPAAPAARPAMAGFAVRVLLTLLGAAGLVVGGLLEWLNSFGMKFEGTDLSYRVLWASRDVLTNDWWKSAGAIMMAIGAVAVLGLLPRSGILTRFAGVLGVIGFALFAQNVYRHSDLEVSDFRIGIWLCLAGGLVALIGGFFGTRTAVARAPAPATTSPTASTYTE